MKRKKVGTITLAITLIALGVILLLNNFYFIDVFQILKVMSAVSIILIGIEFIFFDWFYRKSEDNIAIKISVSSIILLIIIYSTSFLFSSIHVLDGYSNYWIRGIFEDRNEFEVTKDYIENAEKFNLLNVDNDKGSIEIQAVETDDVIIKAVIRVSTYKEEEEAMVLTNNIINIDKSMGNTLDIKTNNKIFNYSDTIVYVDFTIEVPKHLDIKLNNSHGDIIAEDIIRKSIIKNSHGNIEIENIDNELIVENKHGNIHIDNITGVTKVTNSHGRINVENIDSDIDIKNRHSSTIFKNIKGNVIVKQSHGEVEGNKIDKNVEIVAEHTEVKVDGVNGEADIETTHNKIDLKNISSNINLVNEHGSIDLEKIKGNIKINSTHGSINLDNYDILLKNVDIDSTHGSIKINIPNNQQGKFDLRAEHGNINSIIDFEINKDNNLQLVNSIQGDSTNSIIMNSNHGDIIIK
ncbi:MAG: hypothetical protein N4A63_04095 [Vallitalea sp.]|jgi:hypothetical protein|nr:hypothetical protein [Vallitalea sp.]